MILIASKNIKGITVEISGDVTGLDKALSSVDKKSKDLGSELKQVNRLLKLDPNNVVLAAQKQKILSEQIDNTNDRLKTLKNVQAQVERQYASGEIDDGAYRAFQREVEETEIALRRLEGQLRDTKRELNNVGKETKQTGDESKEAEKKTSKFAENLKQAFTFGAVVSMLQSVVSSITSLIESSMELSADMSRFEQNISNSTNSLGAMENHLRDVTALTGETDSSIEALSNLMAIGFDDSEMQQAVEGLSGAVVKFPDTLKIESLSDSLQETIATGKGVGQFSELLERSGLNLEKFDAEMAKGKTVADKQRIALEWLAKTGLSDVAAEYKNSNETLLDYNAATYDAAIASAEMAENLMPLSTIGAEIKTKLFKMLSSELASVMPEVQKFAKNAMSYVKSFTPQLRSTYNSIKKILKSVTAILGDLAKDLEPLFKDAFDIIVNTLEFVGPALKGIYNTIKPIVSVVIKLAGWLLKIVNWVSDLVFSFGGTSKAVEALSDETENLTENVRAAKEEWEELNESAGQSLLVADEEIDNVELLRDQLSLLVDDNGKLIGSEESLRVVLKKLADEGFNASYNSQKQQITNYQKLRDEIQKTIDLKLYESRINALAEIESEAWKQQIESLAQYEDLNSQLTAVNNELDKIADFNANTQEWVLIDSGEWENFKSLQTQYYDLNRSMNEAKDTYNEATDAINAYEEALAAGAEGDYTAAIKISEDYFKTTVEGVANTKNVTLQSLDELESSISNKISSTQSALATYDFEFARHIRKGLDDLVLEYAAKGGNIEKYADDFRLIGYKIPESIAEGMNNNAEAAGDAGKNIVEAAEEGVRDTADMHSPSKVFIGYGENLIDGLIIGMKNRREKVRQMAESIARIASNAMKSVLKINSPSKLTRTYGQFFSEGLERGMLDRIRDVQNVSARLAASAAMPIANTSSSSFNVYNTNHFNTTAARDGTALVRQINRDLGAMYYKR